MSADEAAEDDAFGKVIGAREGRWPLVVAEGGFPAKFCSSHWGERTWEAPSSAVQGAPSAATLLARARSCLKPLACCSDSSSCSRESSPLLTALGVGQQELDYCSRNDAFM